MKSKLKEQVNLLQKEGVFKLHSLNNLEKIKEILKKINQNIIEIGKTLKENL